MKQEKVGLGTFHRRPISPSPISPTKIYTDEKFHRRRISPTKNFTDGKFHRQKISPMANFTENKNFTEIFLIFFFEFFEGKSGKIYVIFNKLLFKIFRNEKVLGRITSKI
jgi:hypothetical protein